MEYQKPSANKNPLTLIQEIVIVESKHEMICGDYNNGHGKQILICTIFGDHHSIQHLVIMKVSNPLAN